MSSSSFATDICVKYVSRLLVVINYSGFSFHKVMLMYPVYPDMYGAAGMFRSVRLIVCANLSLPILTSVIPVLPMVESHPCGRPLRVSEIRMVS